MKNVDIMNSKQTKLGILDADVVKRIIDADSTLYPDEVDRIDKFITTVEKLKDHHADRFVDYEYDIDNCLADLFQTMLNVAYDLRKEVTTGIIRSKRTEMLEKHTVNKLETED